jgi:protease I
VSPEVMAAGGAYPDLQMHEAQLDRNLVTAPAWPAHPAWLAAFLRVLGTVIEP